MGCFGAIFWVLVKWFLIWKKGGGGIGISNDQITFIFRKCFGIVWRYWSVTFSSLYKAEIYFLWYVWCIPPLYSEYFNWDQNPNSSCGPTVNDWLIDSATGNIMWSCKFSPTGRSATTSIWKFTKFEIYLRNHINQHCTLVIAIANNSVAKMHAAIFFFWLMFGIYLFGSCCQYQFGCWKQIWPIITLYLEEQFFRKWKPEQTNHKPMIDFIPCVKNTTHNFICDRHWL